MCSCNKCTTLVRDTDNEESYTEDKVLYTQSYGFSNSQVWIWELDHKEGWMLKNWCFWTVVLSKTRESPLWTARRSNQSILKEINPEYSLEGLMLKLETPILWPPDAKNWLIRKDSDAGKDWRQEEKGMTEDEMVGWHHWLNGHEFEWTPGDGEAQGGGLQSMGSQRVGHDRATEQQGAGSVSEISVLSAQVCHKFKTALKNKMN